MKTAIWISLLGLLIGMASITPVYYKDEVTIWHLTLYALFFGIGVWCGLLAFHK